MTRYESDSVLLLNIFVQTDTETLYLPRSQIAMIVPIFKFLILLSSTAKPSLKITYQEYPQMHFTKLISEKSFNPGLPLEVVLPIAEEDSTNK